MADRDYPTIQQHEPLPIPKSWTPEEKRYAAKLEEVLDDIYRRFGRLRMQDLGDKLRGSIVGSEKAVSELRQSDESFTATFRDIGAAGEPAGVIKQDKYGVEVAHTDIGAKTQMKADGFKIVRVSDGKTIGGVYKIGEKVYAAMQSLVNPDQPGFEVEVSPRTFGDEADGYLNFIVNGEDAGHIMVVNHNGRKSITLEGGDYVYLKSGGDIMFQFFAENPFTGVQENMTLTASEIWHAVSLILS